jgi:hypothetical protein
MVMKKFFAVVLTCLSINIYAQQTETRNIGSFTGVKAAEGIQTYLKKGDKESVKVEVTGAEPSSIVTEISGSYLKIHMRHGNFKHVNAKVYVTYVNVDKLSVMSAGSIFSDGVIHSEEMEIGASSAGNIKVEIETSTVNASASSAGNIELKGKAKSAIMESASAGEIDAYNLEAENVEAEASSAGSVKTSVTKSLEASASSGGSIRYRGNPDRNNTSSSSGGSVKKTN